MKCPQLEEMVQYLDGEVSVNRHEDLDHHLEQCPACSGQRQQLRRMIGRLEQDEGEFLDPQLVSEVMSRIDRAPAAPARRWRWSASWRFAIPVLAAAAAVTVAVLWLPRGGQYPGQPEQSVPPEFRVRGGGAAADAERWISLWIYERDAGHESYSKVGQTIAADTSLVFGYSNVKGAYAHLMIFAVSQNGEVFWYYPAYDRPGTNPQSIDIQAGRRELKDEIQHELTPGLIRVFGLFSQRPLLVSEVEQVVKRRIQVHKDLAGLKRLPLPDTGQVSRLIRVVSAVTGTD